MIDLKREVNSLLEKQGQPKKYQAPEQIEKETGFKGSRIQGEWLKDKGRGFEKARDKL